MLTINTNNSDRTKELGIDIGKLLSSGDIICLSGDLGTGKTTFVNGLANGLEIKEYITSPTFTIVNEYVGKYKLYHFDVYRINDPEELYNIGFDEYIYSEDISVIEWAELVSEIVPKEKLWIKITKNTDISDEYRKFEIDSIGNRYELLINELIKRWTD